MTELKKKQHLSFNDLYGEFYLSTFILITDTFGPALTFIISSFLFLFFPLAFEKNFNLAIPSTLDNHLKMLCS